jgi:hypothetical protein
VAQEVDVRHRLLAAERWDAAGLGDPARELARGVALHAQHPADELGDVLGAAGVHPQDRAVQRRAVLRDRDGAGPLRGRDDRDDAPRIVPVRPQARGRGGDRPPPVLGILLGAAVGQ